MDVAATRSQLAAALERVAAGDRTALRIVYQDTSAKLFGVCLRILNDRSEAEDVLQEVYVTVWRKAATFDPGRASPITWMVAIARNRAIDRLRASAPSRRMAPIELAGEVRDPTPAAVDRVAAAQEHQRLAACLEELEAHHSAAIRFKTVEGDQLWVEHKGSMLTIWDAKGNASKVTIQNVFQSNGVIHVVDTVLMPG